MKDQRKFDRGAGKIAIKFGFPGEQVEHESAGENIGGGGVRLLTDKKLMPGSVLNMRIFLPDCSTPIIATGKVIWQTVTDESRRRTPGSYRTGILFTEIFIQGRNRIIQFVSDSGKRV
jgi:hypothetical protein